jgi:peptide deformylase
MLSKEVPEYTDSILRIKNLIERMKLTRKKYGAVGLAANQCNYSVRMFVIGSDDWEAVCINPKVLEVSKVIERKQEGCLSFPVLILNISRPDWVKAEFTDENGEQIVITLSGVTARAYLHELDHLNGIKFTDHVGRLAIQLAKNKKKKLIRRYKRKQKFDNA